MTPRPTEKEANRMVAEFSPKEAPLTVHNIAECIADDRMDPDKLEDANQKLFDLCRPMIEEERRKLYAEADPLIEIERQASEPETGPIEAMERQHLQHLERAVTRWYAWRPPQHIPFEPEDLEPPAPGPEDLHLVALIFHDNGRKVLSPEAVAKLTKETNREHRDDGNPFAPLCDGFTPRPPTVEAETRNDAILPGPFVHTNNYDRRIGSLNFQPAGHLAETKQGVQYLPGFNAGEEYGEPMSPSLPLELFRLGGGRFAGGRGERLPLRLIVDLLSAVPVYARTNGPRRLEILMKDMVRRHYPGSKRPHPSQYRHVQAGMDLIHNFRFPWKDPKTGNGGYWAPFAVRNIPYARGNAIIAVDVDLPPGSQNGFIFDRAAAFRLGPTSAAAFRLFLSLSASWFDPGNLRIPLGGRKHYVQTRKIERYPRVNDAQLIAFTYPAGHHRKTANALADAEDALNRLVADKLVVIGPGRRIMPGPKWAGWNTK